MHNLKIKTSVANGTTAPIIKVYLDDVELKWLTEISFFQDLKGMPKATLTMHVNEVDIDALCWIEVKSNVTSK